MIRKGHFKLSIENMCILLTVCRSSLYTKPRGTSRLNLELMAKMDEHYLEHPYKGAPRMHTYLTLDCGYLINSKRTARLYYEVMGLRAIMPGPHTSKRNKDHSVYPYLLRGLEIARPNQVWATDITYIPMEKGFMYLTAIIDLYSRFVVGWSLSNTMDAQWCADLLKEAVDNYGNPEIINTDQGAQYTSEIFTTTVLELGIKLSMDEEGMILKGECQNGIQESEPQRGWVSTATDNAFIERLWRSVKYEKVYLMPSTDGMHLHLLLNEYFHYYNYKRRHSSIADYHPATIYKPQLKVAA